MQRSTNASFPLKLFFIIMISLWCNHKIPFSLQNASGNFGKSVYGTKLIITDRRKWRHRTWSSLVQVMSSRLSGTVPLYERLYTDMSSIVSPGVNFSAIQARLKTPFNKIYWKMPSTQCMLFCPGLDILNFPFMELRFTWEILSNIATIMPFSYL